MNHSEEFYIGGAWVRPVGQTLCDVVNPATEQVTGQVALGAAEDIDRAVTAARNAFPAWSLSSRADRLTLLSQILEEYMRRYDDMVEAITLEMGAPRRISRDVQAAMGRTHLSTALEVLRDYRFAWDRGTTRIEKEPIGVCGLITPWNWPINQVASKVVPALATGCTMVLKPSEIAPFSSLIWAEILDAAGTPAGVFNLVNGDGPGAGAALSRHDEVDMVSFTGSTRAGVEVARNAAPTVKRVHQELGGKSANILLADVDLERAIGHCIRAVTLNSGQNCNAPTRLLVPVEHLPEVERIAGQMIETVSVGHPDGDVEMGPVVSARQWRSIQDLIESGIEEGAHLLCGGPGRPEGLETGFYVRPTVFSRATERMRIARDEIFGPVLTILSYDTLEDAIEMANDTPYGLASYVSGRDQAAVHAVAARMRSGQVVLNGAPADPMAPFGGYKQSGNGREWGDFAFDEFLEVKAILGFRPV
ncbi:aldehyde dehydrogenase family protein [Kineobactrum salinum]|uniref:Aldehyde dehydrogenase family protein n=1 Tax=Kineobactrum salinum TaxID=2708301 RepID=A0A6C0TYP2_9GAMM|nr:aldehyde dehydrogenase family protein [Kineobactrum salinum]QIB64952.1 aldehyde dehydrogenase family protein [Kineobactrum salinum]